MDGDKTWTSVTVGLTAALLIVWMQRHQRWNYFINGLAGRYVIIGSRGGTASSSPSSGLPTGPPLKITQM